MKRKICILLVMILAFCACSGCGKKDKKEANTKKQDKVEKETDNAVLEDVSNNVEESDSTEQKPVAEESNVEQKQPQNQSQNKNQNQQKQQQQQQQQQQQPVVEQGVVNPTIKASTTNINLDNSAQVVNITISHLDVGDVVFNIADQSVCSCQWGNWSGMTIPLTITPLKTGNTTVTVSLPSYNKSITISVASKVTTPADLSSLTIDKVGGEYKNYSGKDYNISKVNSAEYTITNSWLDNGMIDITVNGTTSMIEHNLSSDYIHFRYEFINSSGICVKSGYVIKQSTQLNQLYTYSIGISSVAPGTYTLKFSDEETWKQ